MGRSKHKKDVLQQVHVEGSFQFIYTNLVSENQELKKQLQEMKGRRDELEEQLKQKDKTIDELKKENAELRNEIEALKQTNIRLEQRISELENKQVKEQKKQLYRTFAIMLYDIDTYYGLKNVLLTPYNKAIYKIRSSRIGLEHYIDERDDIKFKEYKCKFMAQHIAQFDSIKDLVKQKTGIDGIIERVAEFINKQVNTNDITEDEIQQVEEWWVEHIVE